LAESKVAPLAAFLASLLAAYVTFRWIENPIRYRTLSSRTVILTTLVSAAIILALSLTLIQGASRGWSSDSIRMMQAQTSATPLWLRGCNSSVPIGQRENQCEWNAEGTGTPIYMVGDSVAGALGSGFLDAATKLDRPVLVGTKGACPFIDARITHGSGIDEDCNRFVQESLVDLTDMEEGDIVISSSLGYTEIDGLGIEIDKNFAFAFSSEDKSVAYEDALGRVVRYLRDAGHNVTFVSSPAGFPQTITAERGWLPADCTTFQALINTRDCGPSRLEDEVIKETEGVFQSLERTVQEAGGRWWNPRESLCVEGRCHTVNSEGWMYLDSTHLSVFGSSLLEADFHKLFT